MTATTASPQQWRGERLDANVLSLAMFNTTGNHSGAAPEPITAAVSDGVSAWVVPAFQLNTFLHVHAAAHIVCHDVGELYRALFASTAIVADVTVQRIFFELVRAGRMVDIMLLDQLVRLAKDGTQRQRVRTLRELAKEYTDVTLLDESAVKVLIVAFQSSSAQAEQPLEIEAIRQAEAIMKVFAALQKHAPAVVEASAVPTPSSRFGPLSLNVQVRGAVALAHARHNGVRLGTGAFLKIQNACKRARDIACARLLKDDDTRQWLKTSTPELAKVLTNGSVDVRRQKLIRWLEQTSSSITGLHRTEFVSPQGSDDPADWVDLTCSHPLLRAWSDMTMAPDVARSCVVVGSPRLHLQYEILPRLRSYGPDLDLLRRFGVNDVFEPEAGSVFLAVRLRDLTLRSLAAVCLNANSGRSTLAEVFARGDDPYEYAAAALAGMSITPLGALATRASEDHKRWLRIARILLSAAPMGLSEDCICAILREEPCLAGVTGVGATAWHRQLLVDIFPELANYLRDDTWDVMAANMGYTVNGLNKQLRACFGSTPPPMGQLRKWYSQFRQLTGRTRECVQALLDHGTRYPTLERIIYDGSDRDLWLAIFGKDVVALTGRVRGRLPFGQARGAEYLDLADDAAKSALFVVVAAGFKVAAYADETILIEMVEAPDTAGQAEAVKKLAREAAEEVLCGVTVTCDGEWLSCW